MKKILFFLLAILLSVQCVHNQKQKIEDTTTPMEKYVKKYQIKESAIKKNNQAVKIYISTEGSKNKDSLTKAIHLLDEALNISPKYSIAYGNKIQYLTIMGKVKEASEVIDQALIELPEDPKMHFIRGVYYGKEGLKEQAQKSFEQAIFYYDKLIVQNPNDFEALYERAFYMLFAKNKESAMKEFKILQKKYKNDSQKQKELDLTINNILAKMNREKFITELWNQ